MCSIVVSKHRKAPPIIRIHPKARTGYCPMHEPACTTLKHISSLDYISIQGQTADAHLFKNAPTNVQGVALTTGIVTTRGEFDLPSQPTVGRERTPLKRVL